MLKLVNNDGSYINMYLEKPHKCTNLHDFGKFNINHINLILLVYLQINAVCLYVPANKRIIQTNANIYTYIFFIF